MRNQACARIEFVAKRDSFLRAIQHLNWLTDEKTITCSFLLQLHDKDPVAESWMICTNIMVLD